MATDDPRTEQMRTHSDEDQEPPVTTTPPPGEMAQRFEKDDGATDEIGNPIEDEDEAKASGK